MKKTILLLSLFLMLVTSSFAQTVADCNVAVAQFATGYTYDAVNKVISDAYFSVKAEGLATSKVAPPFRVSLYLAACDAMGLDTGSVAYFGWDTVVSNLHQGSTVNFTGAGFTIASLAGPSAPPAGQYRLALWVNSDNAITTTDFFSDNFKTLSAVGVPASQDNIIQVPVLSTTGINQVNSSVAGVSVYPNPVIGVSSLRFTTDKEQEVKVVVYDVTGQLVKSLLNSTMASGTHTIALDATELAHGLYYAAITTKEGTITQKFAK